MGYARFPVERSPAGGILPWPMEDDEIDRIVARSVVTDICPQCDLERVTIGGGICRWCLDGERAQ